MDDRIYDVTLLGSFAVICGDERLSDSAGRMQQVWSLIQYLIIHRENEVTQSELTGALWPDANSTDPSNALKNLAYRARVLLAKSFPGEKRPFILFEHNSYKWNRDIKCSVDSEEMERLKKRSDVLPPDEALNCLCKAIELYKGEFLAKSHLQASVASLRSYCASLYRNCVAAAFTLLIGQGRAEEAARLCSAAAEREPYSELMHELLIRAYLAADDHESAYTHYCYTSELFFRELGVKLGEPIRKLYNETIKSTESIEADLLIIEERLHESEAAQGAYYCSFDVFKSIYRVQSRAMVRSGQSCMVALMTLSNEDGSPPARDVTERAMELLRSVLVSSLRRSDVIAPFSPTQYVVLLGTLTPDNSHVVIDRLRGRFDKLRGSAGVTLHGNLIPVKPRA